MHGLDTGAAPSTFTRVAMKVGDVLLLPLARPILERGTAATGGGGWSYMALGLNSLVWGLVLAWLGGLLGRRTAGGVHLRQT